MEELSREQLEEVFNKGIMVKQIVWSKGKGYQIRERRLGQDFDYKYNYYNRDNELYCYYYKGEDYQLIQETKALEKYNGLSKDTDFDWKIILTGAPRVITIAEYEAMKYVIQNETDEWSKSPYSMSFYSSKNISWGYKPEGSLRVSDHWNFGYEGENCPTAEPVEGWAVCRFENGKYHLIQKF